MHGAALSDGDNAIILLSCRFLYSSMPILWPEPISYLSHPVVVSSYGI